MTVNVKVSVGGRVQVRVGVTGDVGGEVVTMVRGDGGETPVVADFYLAAGAVILVGPETALAAPDQGLPETPVRPDNALPPGSPGAPDNSLPSGGRPDNSLPSGGRPDNSLPPTPAKPGHDLPDSAAPKSGGKK